MSAVRPPAGMVMHAGASPWAEPTASPIPDAPPGLAAELAPVVLGLVPAVAARIPAAPAAVLGRLGAPTAPAPVGWPVHPERLVDQSLADRLLGALELTVDELVVEAPAALAPHVHMDRTTGSVATVHGSSESETRAALRLLEQFAPTLRGLIG